MRPGRISGPKHLPDATRLAADARAVLHQELAVVEGTRAS